MSSDSIFTRVGNLVSYNINKATTDPDAQRYADEQAAARRQQDIADAKAAEEKKAAEAAEAKQKANLKDATYDTSTFVTQIFKYIATAFGSSIYILLALYTGHIAANDAIGRAPSYRTLYFIYGTVFSIFVLPYYIIQWMRGTSIKSYAILPLREGVVPQGLEGFFQSFYTFLPDNESIAATTNFQTALRTAIV